MNGFGQSFRRLACCVVIGLAGASIGQAETLTLPPDWFARYVAERTEPAVLTGPVEKRWEADACEAIIHGDRVFLVTHTCPPTTLPVTPANVEELISQWHAGTTLAMECRELQTGRTIWKVDCGQERPQSPTWFGDYILVKILPKLDPLAPRRKPGSAPEPTTRSTNASKGWNESIRLLDAATGRTLKQFGPRHVNPLEKIDRSPWPTSQTGPIERFRLNAELLRKTYLNPKGPTAPVSADPETWTYDDAELLLETFQQKSILRSGAVTGLFAPLLTTTGDLFYVNNNRYMLCRSELRADTQSTWETPLLDVQIPATALSGSNLVTFVSGSSVTAYDVNTGNAIWTHEWPQVTDNYSRSLAALSDGILLLTDPQVPRPAITRSTPAGASTQFGTHLFLTKLTPAGRVVFKQELPISYGYGGMLAGKDAILVYNGSVMGMPMLMEGRIACLTPAESPSKKTEQTGANAARIEDLLRAYDAAHARQRVEICADLAELGHTQVVDRVIADLDAIRRDLESRAKTDPILSEIRPKTQEQAIRAVTKREDRENQHHYVQALGILREPGGIPALMPLLDNDYLRSDVETAILSITDGEPLKCEAFRTWRERRIPELRTRFNQLQYEMEKLAIAEELRILQDPELLEILLAAIKGGKLNADGSVLTTIASLGDKRAIPWLMQLRETTKPSDHHEIDSALGRALGVRLIRADLLPAWWQAHRHLYEQPSRQPSTAN